jgi:hypothetical protein
MKKYEYINDFLYFAVRSEQKDGGNVLIYCSGVNVTRFLPMMQGRLGLGSNPIVSGLQLVKYDLCTMAISKGAEPKDHYCRTACAGMAPTKEGWYTEPLLIERPGNLTPEEIVRFAISSMVKRINATLLSDRTVPYDLEPAELQVHLAALCTPA